LQLGGRHHRGHLRIGFFQKLGIGGRPSFLIAMLDLLVGFLKARQCLVGGKQHRRVRRSQPEHDPSHVHLLGGRSILFR
jgi:hypothetical protein